MANGQKFRMRGGVVKLFGAIARKSQNSAALWINNHTADRNLTTRKRALGFQKGHFHI